jgi:2-oxoglutarate ferredoxin oxidoreductase subunit alpha
MADFEPFPVTYRTDPENFQPFSRDEFLARPWVKPGTPGLMHRIGGIEKDYNSGNISYDAMNHQRMTDVRRDKILNIANDIPEQAVELGNDSGKLAVLGWGSTYGPINRAVANLREDGVDVSHIHLRHIWPLPRNLGDLLGQYDRVLIPEMNDGQLITVIRSEYLIDAIPLNKVTGKPFKINEIENAVHGAIDN